MSGTAVDIISGMPINPAFSRDPKTASADELLAQMQMVSLPASAAAGVVSQKVIQVLMQRIEKVLADDAQAQVCLEILRAIEAPAITAAEAARRYVRRYNLTTPALHTETTPEKDPYP